jgi:hypothetical protein
MNKEDDRSAILQKSLEQKEKLKEVCTPTTSGPRTSWWRAENATTLLKAWIGSSPLQREVPKQRPLRTCTQEFQWRHVNRHLDLLLLLPTSDPPPPEIRCGMDVHSYSTEPQARGKAMLHRSAARNNNVGEDKHRHQNPLWPRHHLHDATGRSSTQLYKHRESGISRHLAAGWREIR